MRTFFKETASAKVEANSGETAIPDVVDMMIQGERAAQRQFTLDCLDCQL